MQDKVKARRRARKVLAAAAAMALLSACTTVEKPLGVEELALQAQADRLLMFAKVEPLTRPLTLPEAIARVLKYNLDHRAKMMEAALASGQARLTRFDLLPDLAASAGYRGRSEFDATTSRDLVTGLPTGGNPTYSQDRDLRTVDLSLTWNILDFGVSYYNARQNADRALIAEEQRRHAVAALIQDVRYAYWRAAAAQKLEGRVAATIARAERALANARQVEKEGLRDPVEALRLQKLILENLHQLEAIQRELAAARIELAALINLPPDADLRLAVPAALPLPAWKLPLERMEELAFLNNPDIREHVYKGRIAADETRKAMLKLLPGIRLDLSGNHDSNSFLVENGWAGAGALISWSVVNLVTGPQRIAQAELAQDVAQAQRLALRMAVLAQVHIANRQFRSALDLYRRTSQIWRVDGRLAEAAAQRQESDAQGMAERVAAETAAIAAHLRRFQAYAQVQAAWGQMQAATGIDALPKTVPSLDLPTLAEAVDDHLKLIAKNGGIPSQKTTQDPGKHPGKPALGNGNPDQDIATQKSIAKINNAVQSAKIAIPAKPNAKTKPKS